MAFADILNGFNPEKDKVSTNNQGLPAGEYDVIIDSIGHHVYESGFECFLVVFQVMTGEHNGQKEYDNISLATQTKSGKAMPSFVLATAVKSLAALAYCAGINKDKLAEPLSLENETDEYEALDKVLKPAQGTTLKLVVKKLNNKKDPDNPYTNYEFEKTEQPEEIDVSDDDMPF
ncbi:DUF669 domain-containing protein [Fructilactobacillus sp. Tb1]|uniref:DUF669 domain-containing protein n=1 Tax=Fructilactobacillus sp. Tb1 TaxID=3422304 RepID=UPI003D2769ED